MANYDQATQDFIHEIAKSAPKDPRVRGQAIRRAGEESRKQPGIIAKKLVKEIGLPDKASPMAKARTAVSIAASIASKKAMPQMVARQATREVLEKQSAQISEEIAYKPLDIYNSLMQKYKAAWFNWETETVREDIPKTLPHLNNEDSYMSIFALQNIIRTNYPAELWNVFENVGQALNENNVMVDQVTPLEIHECALTIETIKNLRPDIEFSEEIDSYIASCAMVDGVVLLPPRYFSNDSQKKLDELNRDPAIKDKILATMQTQEEGDDVINTQIAKIADIKDYVIRNLGGNHG